MSRDDLDLLAAADPVVRRDAHLALLRAGDDRGLDEAILREPDLDVFAVLAVRAARAASLAPRTFAQLVAQAGFPGTRPDVRAGCAWAVAAHDPVRGGWLAGVLLGEPEAAFWLASIVARRGGPLAPIVAHHHAIPAIDRLGAEAERARSQG